jgi:hypothetical protein
MQREHMNNIEQLFRTMVALMSDEEILRMRTRITLRMKDDADGSSLYEALSDELLGRDAIAELNAERQKIELCEWNRGRKLTPPGGEPSLGVGADDRGTVKIEARLLKDKRPVFRQCPLCAAEPFEPSLRGLIQRPKRSWWGLGKPRAYCAVICSNCHKVIGWEEP